MINPNKQYKIETPFGVFRREAVKTHYIRVGENIFDLIEKYISPCYSDGDIVAISSKIVSLCQNRVIYKKDMKVTPLAKILSKFASSSEAGVGVNCVWKMQYAIDYCGRFKVLLAAMCGGIGKIFGRREIFYDIVGMEIRGLDGFYDKSFQEYGEFGIQIPVDCGALCETLYRETGIPVFVADANDFTQDVFGKAETITYSEKELCEILSDNPAGQSNECTPFVIIRKVAR